MKIEVIVKMFFSLLVIILFSLKINSIEIETGSLQTESLYEPLAIDVNNPILSWRLENPQGIRGIDQVARQIRAANSENDLMSNPLWDTGKVLSDSTKIPWNGPILTSRERICWQVRVWDNDGNISKWSSIASFEMGLINWNLSSWIENSDYVTGNNSLPYFVKRFEISHELSSARLWIIGLGQFIATVNGKSIGKDVLNPGYSDWNKTLEYSTYNITSFLNDQENVLGIALGKGIYRAELPLGGRYYKFLTALHPMKLIAQLQLNYTDGTSELIVSDSTWLTTTTGPLLESSWYGGEEYDARQELINWDTPTFNHSTWKQVDMSTIPNPNAIYRARESPPIEIVEEMSAVSISNPRTGTYVVDFGINHAGWPQITMNGYRGLIVTMRPAELLQSDGTINQNTEGTPIFDRYTFATNNTETYIPSFRYFHIDFFFKIFLNSFK